MRTERLPFSERRKPRRNLDPKIAPQHLGTGIRPKLRNRLILDLPDALPRQIEPLPDILQRHRMVDPDPKEKADHLLLPLRQRPQGPVDLLLQRFFMLDIGL